MWGLPPLVGSDARILVLGSFPSVASLADQEYYAYERNHFWFLVSAILDEPLPAIWAQKTALLNKHGVAVWDVIAKCERAGSLDQAIRNAKPNPIPAFLADHPGIVRVVFNGTKAADTFARHFGVRGPVPLAPVGPMTWDIGSCKEAVPSRIVSLVRVPSSSPVPSRAFRNAGDKLEAWKAAFRSSREAVVVPARPGYP